MPPVPSAAPPPDAAGAPQAPDAWRVEVFRREERDDPAARSLTALLPELGLPARGALRTGRGLLLSPRFAADDVRRVVRELYADPVLDEARVTPPRGAPARPADVRHRILVCPRAGVMDPVARTVEDLLRSLALAPREGAAGVATFRVLELTGAYAPAELATLAQRVLANETIEAVRIDREDLPYGARLPRARRGRALVALLDADDERLARLSAEGGLSLSLEEMRAVRAHFAALGREPSACELETLAQTWSEHCKHKTLTGRIAFTGPDGEREEIDNLLRETIARATRELARDFCVSVFEDNAGIVAFDQGQDVCIKVETHNHPSAIDPYGGAGTGIGGVIRDVLGAGLGARPIANTDCFFVGPPDLPEERVPRGTLHPRRILRGVVAGVRDYGNRMGIPTVNGGVWFHEGYVANPLVYAGTVGILPHACARKQVRAGDLIVSVGGRTGRDGIHGATFSSVELTEDSESVSSSAVQIGDPITEKRVLDALLVARDRGLYRSVTDCGAGGFSSAVGEMGAETGAEVHLERVPLKYEGLSSHEVWISEAQERMVLAVPPEHEAELVALFAAEDVEATVIGRFTGDGRLVVRDEGEIVAELDMAFLHGGTPRPLREARWQPAPRRDAGVPRPRDAGATLHALLRSPETASKEWIVRQYDHEVQGASVVKPLVGPLGIGPSDAAVLQPLPSSRRGLAIACGAHPRAGLADPGAMAELAIDEALRNAVAVGADPDCTAILDNFSWGNCAMPDRLGSLVVCARACYRAAKAYRTPFVSGKDSLNNEYRVGGRTLSIPPTLLVTALAQVPDVGRAVTMDLKRAGNRVLLLGETRAELGASAYLALPEHAALEGTGAVPRPDLERAPALLRALHAALAAGLVQSCHDLSEGGLAVAAAEMALAGDLGLALELARLELAETSGADPDTVALFSESATRFLLEVAPAELPALRARLAGFPLVDLGSVEAAPRLRVLGRDGRALLDEALDGLRASFQGGFAG